MKTYLALLVAILVSGCASEIMRGYVGGDITEPMLDYGPPSNVLELPDGRTAFQWSITSSYTAPITTNVYGYGSSATAVTTGGGTSYSECLYTLYGMPNPQGSFTVTGFREPNLLCE